MVVHKDPYYIGPISVRTLFSNCSKYCRTGARLRVPPTKHCSTPTQTAEFVSFFFFVATSSVGACGAEAQDVYAWHRVDGLDIGTLRAATGSLPLQDVDSARADMLCVRRPQLFILEVRSPDTDYKG